ncbi:Uncharacterised protein [Mycobacteroides abscessus subsp. abscessus]|nr:Uncharacterised protein [Mycobacteroides abscessus subsp. abscessus]
MSKQRAIDNRLIGATGLHRKVVLSIQSALVAIAIAASARARHADPSRIATENAHTTKRAALRGIPRQSHRYRPTTGQRITLLLLVLLLLIQLLSSVVLLVLGLLLTRLFLLPLLRLLALLWRLLLRRLVIRIRFTGTLRVRRGRLIVRDLRAVSGLLRLLGLLPSLLPRNLLRAR